MLNIHEPQSTGRFALWQLAFRPFFLLGPLMALWDMGMWVAHYSGAWLFASYWQGMAAHSHEMIYGFAMAIVSGFLLTAARNWTGRDTVNGSPLAWLVAVWLAARILVWMPVPRLLIAAVDLAFLPLVAFHLGRVLLPARQKRNYLFLPILTLFWLGNAMMHLDRLGYWPGMAHHGLYLGVDMLLVLISVLGGRVIPFFTERGAGVPVKRRPKLDVAASLLMLAYALTHQVAYAGTAIASVAALALTAQAWRWLGWWVKGVWQVPLLWSLHLAYGWILIGLAMTVVQPWVTMDPWLPVHAMTAGGISGMILAMMARVSLGHTGRLLQPPMAVVVAFVFLHVAAAFRVFLPLIQPDWKMAAVVLSGSLWVLAFALFVGAYGPMLVKPRVDGLPG
jgi:uncharacterized protein involved in response to NO